jgi:import inner membrane translocase subunit TIM10
MLTYVFLSRSFHVTLSLHFQLRSRSRSRSRSSVLHRVSALRSPPRLPTSPTHSNRLVNSCHQKCIQPVPTGHRYAEADLSKGEALCVDRCTAKFLEVNRKVGEHMQAMGAAAQANGGSFGR